MGGFHARLAPRSTQFAGGSAWEVMKVTGRSIDQGYPMYRYLGESVVAMGFRWMFTENDEHDRLLVFPFQRFINSLD